MKTLHRSTETHWYITDEKDVIAHTIGMKGKKLLSLANIEEKIREWDIEETANLNPYGINTVNGLIWHGAVRWAKKHYKTTLPDTYEVEVEMKGDFMMVTKVLNAL